MMKQRYGERLVIPERCIPWSGYTVQVNTKLCRPIPISAQLYIQGTITNIVQRKVHLTVVLYDDLIPNTDDIDDIKYRYDDRGTSYHLCHGGRDCCHESWDIMTHHHHYIFGRDLPHMKCFRSWIIS